MPQPYPSDHRYQDTEPDRLRQSIDKALAARPLERLHCVTGNEGIPPGSRTGVPRLTLVLSGERRVTWAHEGEVRTHVLPAGTGILVTERAWSKPEGPHQRHRYLSVDCYPDFTRFMCEHTGGDRRPHADDGAFYSGGPLRVPARHLLQAMLALAEQGAEERAQAIMTVFLAEVLRDCRPWQPQSPAEEHWHRAAVVAQEELGPELSRDRIARLVGVHPNHLSRLCKTFTGMSLRDYLTGLRITRAQELLRDPSMTVAAIVNAAGYRDETHFRKRFKQVCGVTPGVWRQALGE